MHFFISVAPRRWFATPLQHAVYGWLYSAWLLAEVGLRITSRRAAGGRRGRRREDHSGDRGSYLTVALGVLLALGLSYAARSAAPAEGLLTVWCFWLGAVLMLGGMVLRLWAVHTLGRFFNVVVSIRPDHHLVTSGPYRWLRHPAYTGSLMTLLGIPLCLRTGLGLAAAALLVPLVFGVRMRVEERALLERFGDEYADFMRRRWRLVPFLY